MKKAEKDLLLKDLCGRLPYGIKVLYQVGSQIPDIKFFDGKQYEELKYGSILDDWLKCTFKPYLFPISSMTEEQKKEYYSLADDVTIKPGQGSYLGIKIHCIKLGISDNPHEEVWDYINLDALEWLNKNHFDYRGLIEKGLAITTTGVNIY